MTVFQNNITIWNRNRQEQEKQAQAAKRDKKDGRDENYTSLDAF